MKMHDYIIAPLLCLAVVLSVTSSAAIAGITDTKHNLSKSGPGTIKATSEERICVFCHTPHNAFPQTPLWNKNIEARNYTLYSSTTMVAAMSLPTGPSRLCLSCHDGTLALGEVRKPSSAIAMSTQYISSGSSFLGTTLEKNHPVSFSYYSSLPNSELHPVPPTELLFYGNGVIHCSTCHDPHDNINKKFLRVNSVNSQLCILCHAITGWETSSHNKSTSSWNNTPPNPWPRTSSLGIWELGWTRVDQNGCENCHAPHSAPGEKRLLTCFDGSGICSAFTLEGNCFPCHNGNVGQQMKNIYAQFGAGKVSYHRLTNPYIPHDPLENKDPLLIGGYGHVECVDCHNPHMTNTNKTVTPPSVSGQLDGVSGVTINGVAINPAINEYEICFKCHAQTYNQTLISYTPIIRWSSSDFNTRVEFQTVNPSYHPVAGLGASSDVPSLIPPRNTTSMIFCTDCHSDESVAIGGTGSRGPHGSKFAPILRNQYDTTNLLHSYNASNFQLCYDCHDEGSTGSGILNDYTFQKSSDGRGGHSGHLKTITDANNTTHDVFASCSACHDPHGVPDNGLSGSHKRLINFDTRIVNPLTGSGFSAPIFSGSGNRAGTCALVCHDANGNAVTHDGSTKFSYGGAGAIGPGTIHIHW
jgi:predicted CXXCH cytochrome family protein